MMRESISVPGSWDDREISYLNRRPDGCREGAESQAPNRKSLIVKVVDRLDLALFSESPVRRRRLNLRRIRIH